MVKILGQAMSNPSTPSTKIRRQRVEEIQCLLPAALQSKLTDLPWTNGDCQSQPQSNRRFLWNLWDHRELLVKPQWYVDIFWVSQGTLPFFLYPFLNRVTLAWPQRHQLWMMPWPKLGIFAPTSLTRLHIMLHLLSPNLKQVWNVAPSRSLFANENRLPKSCPEDFGATEMKFLRHWPWNGPMHGPCMALLSSSIKRTQVPCLLL